jgi:hypothetical protein
MAGRLDCENVAASASLFTAESVNNGVRCRNRTELERGLRDGAKSYQLRGGPASRPRLPKPPRIGRHEEVELEGFPPFEWSPATDRWATLGEYTIYIGGRLLGSRLNFIYKDLVLTEEVVPALLPLFACLKQARQNGETVFCSRSAPARGRVRVVWQP